MTEIPLSPPQDDRHRLERGAALVAGLLIGFALMLWVAANWDLLGKMGRFALVAAGVLASGLAAALSARLRTGASLLGVLAIGGLLALFGQTYQTGADPWQLFALWAGLALPWALAARHDSVWAAWVIVVFTALPLWLHAQAGGLWRAEMGLVLAQWGMAGALCLALGPWPGLGARLGAGRWSFRLAVLLTLSLVMAAAIPAAFTASRGTLLLVSLAVLAGACWAFARSRPLDLGLLAASALALDVLVILRLSHALLSGRAGADAFLLVGLLAAGIIALSAVWIIRMARQAGVMASGAEGEPKGMTWPITVLTGIGALFAAVPLIAFLAALLGQALEKGPTLAVSAIAALTGAVWLIRRAAPLGFRQQFGVIALILGLLLAGGATFRDLPLNGAALTMLLLVLGLAGVLRAGWIVVLLGFAAAGFAGFLLHSGLGGGGLRYSALAGRLSVMALLALGAALMLARRQEDQPPALHALLGGWMAAGLLAAMLGAGDTFLMRPLGLSLNGMAGAWSGVGAPLARAASVALAGAGCGLLLWQRPGLRCLTGFLAAAFALVMAGAITSLGAPVLALAASLLAGRRALMLLASLAVLWCLGAFYYALDMSLVHKAYLLAGLGAVLGLVAFKALRSVPGEGALLPLGGRFGPVLIALSVLASLAVVGKGIREKEAVLAQGQVVYVALAPVDPRSLMQGDYMTLRFALPPNAPEKAEGRIYALAKLDSRAIATVYRYALGTPQTPAGEVAFELGLKNGRLFLGSDAFFFKEGQGKPYEQAKFGIFRLTAEGKAVLTGLADADLKPLGPPAAP